MKIWLISVLWMAAACIYAQDQSIRITGRVTAGDGRPLPGALVSVLRMRDSSVIQGTQADGEGKFSISLMRAGRPLLKIGFLGYKDLFKTLEPRFGTTDLGDLVLLEDSRLLGEVVVTESVTPAQTKGDTTEFNARAYKTNPDASAEDLVTKMPGVTVADGKVQAQGEDVRQVTLDGKRFFGEDASAALRNLPAEVIDKIQVFDQRSDQSVFTGFDDGNTFKAINIVTRPQFRDGLFGRSWLGYGSEDRYKAGTSTNFFSGRRRITLLANFNNINEQNFSSEDLAGVLSGSGGQGGGGMRSGMGGMMGGGRPGGGQRFGPPSSSDNFLVDQRSGIVTTRAFGLNYIDQIGKLELSASYFFNTSDNDIQAQLFRTYTSTLNEGLIYSEDRDEDQSNLNHRFNMRAEWKIDSFNSFQFTPRVSTQSTSGIQGTSALNELVLLQLNRTDFVSDRSTFRYNVSAPLLYRHSFARQGRTISAQFTPSWNNGDSKNRLNSYLTDFLTMMSDTVIQDQDGIRNSASYSSNLSYTEPLNKSSQLQISYNHNLSPGSSDQKTFVRAGAVEPAVLDTSLSNVFASDYQSHRASLDYRYNYKIINFNTGLSWQYASLQNQQDFPVPYEFDRDFRNFLPNAGMQVRFSQSKNLRFNYRTSTNQPSAEQLQEVAQINNSVSVSSGNSQLRQDLRHMIFSRYQQNNTVRGTSLFVMAGATFIQDYIGSNLLIADADTTILADIRLPAGAQWTRPDNLDGYVSLRSFLTYGFPVRAIKCNLNLNAGAFFTRTPSLINQEVNYNESLNSSGGFVLSSNISPRLDFTLSSSVVATRIRNSTLPDEITLNTVQNHSARIQWQFWKGLFIQSDILAQVNQGLTGEADRNVVLWNAALGYKMLKNNALDIRVSVFDILDQNASISRVVREAWYDDSFTNVLQQYFLLQASYQLRKYKSQG